jgi:hypothetical protein
MAMVACVLWLTGFEVLPWLHMATHDHVGKHHHDETGAIIRDGESDASRDHDEDHDPDVDEHAEHHDGNRDVDEHAEDHHQDHDVDAATDEHAEDHDDEVDEHGQVVAHHHAHHHHGSSGDRDKRILGALGHGRHSLAHHDIATTSPAPVLTSPLPVDRRPTYVLLAMAIEPFSFSPGRAVARGPPSIVFES